MEFPIIFVLSINLVVASIVLLNVGGISRQFLSNGVLDYVGIQTTAALIMALKEINLNKNILPFARLKLSLRYPPPTFAGAVNTGMTLIQAFNRSGLAGVIVGNEVISTKAIVQLFNDYRINQIGYGATAPELSTKGVYDNYYIRCGTNQANDGLVLAEIVSSFGWQYITVFYNKNSIGLYTFLKLSSRLAALGIVIDSEYGTWPGMNDYSDIINTVKGSSGRNKIFVLLMESYDAGLLIKQGYSLGVFKEGTQLLGSFATLSQDTFTAISSLPLALKAMKGYIGVATDIDRSTDIFKQFIQRWKSQQSTVGKNENGVQICDQTKDDNEEYLYQATTTATTRTTTSTAAEATVSSTANKSKTKVVCLGLNYSTFRDDGLDIADAAILAYDAMYTLAYAHHTAYSVNNCNLDGGPECLTKILLNNISFSGISGLMSFNNKGIESLQFGYGDRNTGLRYRVLNFDPSLYNTSESTDSSGNVASVAAGFRTIAIWTSENGIRACNSSSRRESTSNPSYLSCVSKIVYNTADGNRPSDAISVVEVQISDKYKLIIFISVSIVTVSVLGYTSMLIISRKHGLIKISQPGMMFIALTGIFMGCVKTYFIALDISNFTCVAGMWLGHLSFLLVFGSLILKTWRINRIMLSGLKKVKFSNRDLYRLLSIYLIFFIIYLGIYTYIGNPRKSYQSVTSSGTTDVRLLTCVTSSPAMRYLLFILEGIVLLYGAYECSLAKGLPSAFGDTSLVVISMYAIVFICAGTFPIVVISIDPTPENSMFAMAIGFSLACFVTSQLIFGPKAILIFLGTDVNEKFEVVERQPGSRPGSDQSVRSNKSIGSNSGVASSVRKFLLSTAYNQRGEIVRPSIRGSIRISQQRGSVVPAIVNIPDSSNARIDFSSAVENSNRIALSRNKSIRMALNTPGSPTLSIIGQVNSPSATSQVAYKQSSIEDNENIGCFGTANHEKLEFIQESMQSQSKASNSRE